MSDLPETAAAMAAAVSAGEASPVELVDRALTRLERWQPVTNAFSQVYAEEALSLASAAERAEIGRASCRERV